MKPGSLLITLCTYNERDNVALLVPELLAVVPDAEVLIVDDGSPDGTGRLADEFANENPRVRVLHRAGKQGLGSANLASYRYAIENQYEYLLNLDADYSHPPRFAPQIVAGMQNADVVIGSRYVSGGSIIGWTWQRRVMSWMINFWARLWLGLKTRDNSGSYRCYRVAMLARIDWSLAVSTGYAFQEEILYRCRRAGCRIVESPITFEERRYGTTKINTRECVKAIFDIVVLGFQNLRGVPVLLPGQGEKIGSC
ncbi:MAG: polyprenol monophosphomannose synthase [Planctomyces sp.]|nr:polyprenol monophosphomannose synthase [Planctomyces sp.]